MKMPDLEFSAPRGDQQVSISIPVRPLDVIQQLDLSIHFQPVADTEAVYRQLDTELAPSPAEAFHTKYASAAGLAFPHAGVAPRIPCVPGVALGRVRGFFPATPPFVRKLHYRNAAQAVGDRELRVLGVFAIFRLGEVIAARPGTTRTEGVERGEPGEFRHGHVCLAVFPVGARLVRKVAEESTVGGQVGPSWKDPSTEPGAGLVPSLAKIPAAHMGPIRGPAPEHRHYRRLCGWNTVDPWSNFFLHR